MNKRCERCDKLMENVGARRRWCDVCRNDKKNEYVRDHYARTKKHPHKPILCERCGDLTPKTNNGQKYCAKCVLIVHREVRARGYAKQRGQWSFEERRACADCSEIFLAFNAVEKLCHECKYKHKYESKLRSRNGFTFHQYKEEVEYSAHKEMMQMAYYRIDNDPNNIFNGGHFRKKDIQDMVKDKWLIGADVTHVVTGETKKAEEWK